MDADGFPDAGRAVTGPGKTLSAMLFPPLRRFEADFITVYAPEARL